MNYRISVTSPSPPFCVPLPFCLPSTPYGPGKRRRSERPWLNPPGRRERPNAVTRQSGKPPRRRRWVFALLAVYMTMVFALSHQSQPPLPEYLELLSDKVLHVAEYFPLGFLWALGLGPAGASRALLGWGAATLFGATD